MAQGHRSETVTRRLWVRSPVEGMHYYLLIFSFLCSGNKAKVQRWVPFYNYINFIHISWLKCYTLKRVLNIWNSHIMMSLCARARVCDCKRDKLWVRSLKVRKIKYLLFSFLRFGVNVQHGVEFRYSTRSASAAWDTVWNWKKNCHLLGYFLERLIPYY